MEKEDLVKLVNQEIEWLCYYGYREDRMKLTINSDIYKELRSIGYTKRVVPLDKRCAPCLINNNNEIVENSNISNLQIDCFPKDGNKLTPLEAFIVIYPSEKENCIIRIRN